MADQGEGTEPMPDLPEGWEMRTSRSTGKLYFIKFLYAMHGMHHLHAI